MKSLINKLAITTLVTATIFSCQKENINQLKPNSNNEIVMNNQSVKLDTPYTSYKSADTPYVNVGNFIRLDTPYIHKNGIDTPYVKKYQNLKNSNLMGNVKVDFAVLCKNLGKN